MLRLPKVLLLSVFFLISLLNAKPYNFLFILVDDLGIKDLGVEGSKFHETQNIDKLAKKGMRFTQGYSTSQVCSPSRASLLTGTYPVRHGITDWIGAASGLKWDRNDKLLPAEYIHSLPKEDTTIAEALKEHSYKTFFAGKWHLGGKGSWPKDHGFDINIGGWNVGSPKGGFYAPWNNPNLESGPDGESLTLRLAEETAAFMEAHKDEKFFAYLSFYTVHGPIETTQELWKKYRDKAAQSGLAKERFKFDRTRIVRQVQDNPVYAGMMETLDEAVAIVLDKLEETGLDKNTVVIFTSDNGGVSSGDSFSTSALPLRGGKGRQWEGGILQPFYIYVPGMSEAGSTTDTPVIGTDFYPTILELAGVPLRPKQHKDGISLVPALKGKELKPRDLFWHYPHYGNQGGEPSAIIRSGSWKLIHYFEDGRDELYNIKSDIGEQNDLASKHLVLKLRLRDLLDRWLDSVGAKIPEQDSRFDPLKKAKQLENAEVGEKKHYENKHAAYLKEKWNPGNNWWGSHVPKD